MLNYFRSKKTLNRQIDELENKCAVLSGKLRGIESINDSFFKDYQSVNELNKNLNSENARLEAEIEELCITHSDTIDSLNEVIRSKNSAIEDLKTEFEKSIINYNILSDEYGELKRGNSELEGEYLKLREENIDFRIKIKQLEAENLGLLNKITNEDKFHDPYLKIDLNKPIRNKNTNKIAKIEFQGVAKLYMVGDEKYSCEYVGLNTHDINENYENYEPETKVEDTGLGVNPLSVKNIVPKKEDKYPIGDEKDKVSLSSKQKKVPSKIVWGGRVPIKKNEYTIIDMTKKSKAVRHFFEKNLLTDNGDGTKSYIWEKDENILPPLYSFNFGAWNISRDNIERIVNKWRKGVLIYKTNGFHRAAKPIKIILEKEK